MNYYLEAFKKYAVFQGRATRSEYWYFVLFNVIVAIVLSVVIAVLAAAFRNDGFAPAFVAILWLYMLAIIIPSISIGVRRLHDTGRSGWWMLIDLIPFGGLVLLVFFVLDSQPGDNKYGPNPKGVPAVATYIPAPAPAVEPVQAPAPAEVPMAAPVSEPEAAAADESSAPAA